jgi:excisionase family DNA binding protein
MSDFVPRKRVSFKAASEKAGCGRSKMYDLIAEGLVVAYKDGRLTKVDDDSLDAYLASRPRAVIKPSKRKQHGKPAAPAAAEPV